MSQTQRLFGANGMIMQQCFSPDGDVVDTGVRVRVDTVEAMSHS